MVSKRPISKIKTRPFHERVRFYGEALNLSKRGLNGTQIARELERRFGARLDPGQVRLWVLGKASPYGRVHCLELRQIPELAYVIGVKLGDGSLSRNWHHNYMVKLRVSDKEFAEEFARCVSVVLRCRPIKVWWYAERKLWAAEPSSMLLSGFLGSMLDRFKPFVEHCGLCASAFLRGIFDSEGSVGKDDLRLSNTNSYLLSYVQDLLDNKYAIETTGPYLAGPRPGTVQFIRGRLAHVNKQCYDIRVRPRCYARFSDSIGFTIGRKKKSLASLVNQKQNRRAARSDCGR